MSEFKKGLLVGALGMVAIGSILAAASTSDKGRYQGLDREGPIIVLDTQTGDIMAQRGDGGFEGHRWADAWKAD